MELDSQHVLFFAPLQGETAKQILPENLRSVEHLTTLVYARKNDLGWEFLTRSTAVLVAIKDSAKFALGAKLLLLIPPILRDTVYDFIAKNRHRLNSANYCEPLPDKFKPQVLN